MIGGAPRAPPAFNRVKDFFFAFCDSQIINLKQSCVEDDQTPFLLEKDLDHRLSKLFELGNGRIVLLLSTANLRQLTEIHFRQNVWNRMEDRSDTNSCFKRLKPH